jgi:lipoprotein NlpI
LLTHSSVAKKRGVKLASSAGALFSFALLAIARAGISEGAALNYLHQGRDQYRLGNIEAAIADYTEAIKIEPNLSGPYYGRGEARQALGDWRNALADFNTAIQLSPRRWGPAYTDRAAVELYLGNYDAAIVDLTQAVAITPTYGHGYRVRGSAKEFKGDLAGAIADYTEASRLDAANPYSEILLWAVRTRQGQATLANQQLAAYVDRHVEKSTDHWGTKVCAFLLDKIKESEFLTGSHSYFAYDSKGHQCEAWYYIGLKHLLSDNKAAAAEAFRNCLATNARSFDEYIRAAIELKKLSKA